MADVLTYRGMPYVRVTATDVKVGDSVVLMLSDAVAAVKVTSITERVLDLTAHGLGKPVHIAFGYASGTWWVDQSMMTFAKGDDCVCIKPREV